MHFPGDKPPVMWYTSLMTDAESNISRELIKLDQLGDEIWKAIKEYDLGISRLMATRSKLMLSYDQLIAQRAIVEENLQWVQSE